jgi:RNase P/RNase MRP subunit POP5
LLKKVKRRYLALRLDSDATISSREFTDAVWEAICRIYGEYGASQTSLSMINFDVEHGIAVIRTGHTTVEMVRTAIASITHVGDKPAAVHVLAVSGTIKALHKSLKQPPLKHSP